MFMTAAITDESSDRLEPAPALLAEWQLSDDEIHTLRGASLERLGSEQVSRLRQLLTAHGLRVRMPSSTISVHSRVGEGPPPEPRDRRFASIGRTNIQLVAALARCLEIASELKPDESGPRPLAGGRRSDLRHGRSCLQVARRRRPRIRSVDHDGARELLQRASGPDGKGARWSGARGIIPAATALGSVEHMALRRSRRLSLADRAITHLANMHVKGIRLDDELAMSRAYDPLDHGQVNYRRRLGRLRHFGYQVALSLEPRYPLPHAGWEGAAHESFARLTRLLDGIPPMTHASPLERPRRKKEASCPTTIT